MFRTLLMAGLAAGMLYSATPVRAQSVHVEVGVHGGPVAGRVIYDTSPVYRFPPPVGYPVYDEEYSREHYRELAKQRREHEREYWKDVREHERELAKAQREYDRERLKDLREAKREYRKWQRERARDYR